MSSGLSASVDTAGLGATFAGLVDTDAFGLNGLVDTAGLGATFAGLVNTDAFGLVPPECRPVAHAVARAPQPIEAIEPATQHVHPAVVALVVGAAIALTPGIDLVPVIASGILGGVLALVAWAVWALNLDAAQALATFATIVGFCVLFRRPNSD